MTLFIALNEIREQLDPSLAFDFVCRAGICGSCGMLIDGRSVNTSEQDPVINPAFGEPFAATLSPASLASCDRGRTPTAMITRNHTTIDCEVSVRVNRLTVMAATA